MRRFLLAFTYGFVSLLLAIVLGSVLLPFYLWLVSGEEFSFEFVPFAMYICGWFSALLIFPGIVIFYILPAFRFKIIQLILVLIGYTGLTLLLELKFFLPFIYGAGHGDIRTITEFSPPYALAYFASVLFFATRPALGRTFKASK